MPSAIHGRLGPEVYVPQDDWLDVLAGDDPRLRYTADGKPKISVISKDAGLNYTTLGLIDSGRIGVSSWVMGTLVHYLKANRGYTRCQAEAALFDLVPLEDYLSKAAGE